MQSYNNLAVVENSHCQPTLSEINRHLQNTKNQNSTEQLNRNLSEMLLITTIIKY